MSTFAEVLLDAIRDVIARHEAAEAGTIAGFALVVDGGMMAMMPVSMPTVFAHDASNQLVLFSPVNWPTEYRESRQFQEAAGLMEQLDGSSYEARACALGDLVVQVLTTARNTIAPLREAILMFVCADGGGVWDEVEADALRRLNDDATHDAWLAWRSKVRERNAALRARFETHDS